MPQAFYFASGQISFRLSTYRRILATHAAGRFLPYFVFFDVRRGQVIRASGVKERNPAF